MTRSQDPNSHSEPPKKSRLAAGMQLVSFEMPSAWRKRIDKRVDAGEFDSFSAYMRALVRRDLGVANSQGQEARSLHPSQPLETEIIGRAPTKHVPGRPVDSVKAPRRKDDRAR